jgi:hypothetical protein
VREPIGREWECRRPYARRGGVVPATGIVRLVFGSGEQRLDLAPELWISRAGIREERVPVARVAPADLVINAQDLLTAIHSRAQRV